MHFLSLIMNVAYCSLQYYKGILFGVKLQLIGTFATLANWDILFVDIYRNTSEDDSDVGSLWADIPESLLLHIFSYLDAKHLVSVSQTCKVYASINANLTFCCNISIILL